MNNADRIMRVVYKDADLASLYTWPGSCLMQGQERGDICRRFVDGCFYLNPLDRDLHKGFTWKTDYLSLLIQRYLRCYPGNYQEDEVGLLFEKQAQKIKEAYPSAGVNTLFMFLYYAERLFTRKNKNMCVDFSNLLEWNGFTSKIDMNVFYAAYDAVHKESCPDHPTYISLHTDVRIERILKKGYAETHMHVKGSGYSPEMSWYYFIRNSEYNVAKNNKKVEGFAKIFWDNQNIQQQERIALAYQKVPMVRNLLQARLGSHIDEKRRLSAEELLEDLFFVPDNVSLCLFRESAEYQDISSCFLDEIEKDVFSAPLGYVAFEQGFLCQMFRSLFDGQLSALDIYAFNVYLTALTQFKFCMSQDNLGMGFTKFKRAEDNKDYFCDDTVGIKEATFETVFDKYYSECGLKTIEFRITPMSKKKLIKTIDLLDRANKAVFERHKVKRPELKKIKYRLIVHFVKQQLCSDDYGVARKEKLVYQSYKQLRDIESLFELSDDSMFLEEPDSLDTGGFVTDFFDSSPLRSNEYYKRKVAAIDTANYEMNCRPENYAPLFRRFSYGVASRYDTWFTYHVGEDYATLCNGLRAIDEVREFFAYRRGDRLGHAVALGLNVQSYFKLKRNYITVTLQDHVDDLAWMYKIIQRDASEQYQLLSYLEQQYLVYAKKLFVASIGSSKDSYSQMTEFSIGFSIPSIHDYLLGYALRGNDPNLYCNEELYFFPNEGKCHRVKESREADRYAIGRDLYRNYHFNDRIKKNGKEALVLEADGRYIDAVALAQRLVRELVYRDGIVIETNPSSNRKISSVSKYIDLPMLNFNHHGLTLPKHIIVSNTPDIPITINTDDSSIFQTNLQNEYALVVAAFAREGFDMEEAYAYIDYLRELSLQHSFVKE